MVCYSAKMFGYVLFCKESNWRERKISGNRSVLTLLVNVLTFSIVHPWKHHCSKVSLLVFARGIRYQEPPPNTSRSLQCYVNTGYDDCKSTPLYSYCPKVCEHIHRHQCYCTHHICELSVLICLEAQVGSQSLLVTGRVLVCDHSLIQGSGRVCVILKVGGGCFWPSSLYLSALLHSNPALNQACSSFLCSLCLSLYSATEKKRTSAQEGKFRERDKLLHLDWNSATFYLGNMCKKKGAGSWSAEKGRGKGHAHVSSL